MTRHFLLLMAVTLPTLLINQGIASPDPQFHYAFYQQPYPFYDQSVADGPNFQPATFSYNYHPFFNPYHHLMAETDYDGLKSIIGSNVEEENKFFRSWIKRIEPCPLPRLLLPCKCSRTRITGALSPVGNIVCPSLKAADTLSVFSRIPAGLNIQAVILYLPRGTDSANSLGTHFLANYPQAKVTIISPQDTSCIDSTLLSPCTCTGSTITCPANIPGNTMAQFQASFNNIAPNTNLGNVIINMPGGTNRISANFLGKNGANTITLIGSVARPFSQLTIDANAFSASATTCTLITFQQSDLGILDYSFSTGFNALTNILINGCTRTPFAGNPPKSLPELPKLNPVLVDGVIYSGLCPPAASLAPCTCILPPGDQVCTFTCPPGTAFGQITNAFNNVPEKSNIGNIILHLPTGTNSTNTTIPASLLGTNAASTIKIICPAINPLSNLTINETAFTASGDSDTLFTIQQCDVGSVDYIFLKNFNVLKNLLLNQCSNTPTATNPPKNLPKLPNLVSILVDGVIYNAQCPNATILDPCTCVIPPGDQVCTITCPEGSNMRDIVNAFTGISGNSILGNVILNFPTDTTYIPEKILSDNPATTIQLIGPLDPSPPLTIHPSAFVASASATTKLTISRFNMKNVDYSFLTNFHKLNGIFMNQCANSPSAANPPTNLPILPSLVSFLVDGIIYNAQCPDAEKLDPCTCAVAPGEHVCTITCPASCDVFDIVNAFTGIPKNSILGNVILNFPMDTDTVIPSKILANNSATTIHLNGPVGSTPILVIDPGAFTPSSATNTKFTIQQFDVINVNYGFLAGFSVLTEIDVNQCTNAPSAGNLKLPKLPKLTKFSVNGNNIYTP